VCVGFVGLILLVSIMLGVDLVVQAQNIQNNFLNIFLGLGGYLWDWNTT
jgi:hypothetical protein